MIWGPVGSHKGKFFVGYEGGEGFIEELNHWKKLKGGLMKWEAKREPIAASSVSSQGRRGGQVGRGILGVEAGGCERPSPH